MARFKITAPVAGYTGRVGKVAFADGCAEVDGETQAAELSYFRRSGYGVVEVRKGKDVEVEEPPGPAAPARGATKAEWKAYAIGQGITEADAEAMTRDQLAEKYLGPKETS